MSAALILPLKFVASSGDPGSALSPLTNANNDLPGMIWATPVSSYCVIDLLSARAIDTVALISCNLRITDTWRIQGSASNANGTGDYDSGTMTAFTGFKPDINWTDAIKALPAVITVRYLRIDVSAPSHPDNLVMASRIVVGKRVTAQGIDYSAEKGVDDQSILTTGAGYTAVDEFAVYTWWKVQMSWIPEANWRQNWEPLYAQAGMSRAVLFVPDIDTPSQYQTDAIFGRIMSKPSGKADDYNGWVTNPTIQTVGSKIRNR